MAPALHIRNIMKIITAILLSLPLAAQPINVRTACGVVGNKLVDDTAAIQGCIDAAPDYAVLDFPAGLQMRITATINLHNRYGLRLSGLTSMFGGPSMGTAAPTFYWDGADGGKMFDIDRSQNLLIEGLTWYSSMTQSNNPTKGAARIINVDQTIGGGGITSNIKFDRIAAIGAQARTDVFVISFAEHSGQNVEHMTVSNSFIACSNGRSSYGIVIGGSYNAKNHVYERNTITNCGTGIYITNGSANIYNNQFNLTDIDIFASAIDPIVIQGNDSENSVNFLRVQVNNSVVVMSNRIAASNPAPNEGAIQILGGGGSALSLIGNYWDVSDIAGFAFTPGQGGTVISSGNFYPNLAKTLAGARAGGYYAKFRGDLFGYSDVIPEGTTGPYGGGPAGWIAPQNGTLIEATGRPGPESNPKKSLSENGGEYRYVLPDVQASAPPCSYISRVWYDTSSSSTVVKDCLSVSGTLTWVAR